jgi:hypothetical protein
MKESVMSEVPDEFVLQALAVTLSAKGAVALWLATPVSAILLAVAWRIVSKRRP